MNLNIETMIQAVLTTVAIVGLAEICFYLLVKKVKTISSLFKDESVNSKIFMLECFLLFFVASVLLFEHVAAFYVGEHVSAVGMILIFVSCFMFSFLLYVGAEYVLGDRPGR